MWPTTILVVLPLLIRFVVGSAPIWANAGAHCNSQRVPQHTRCTGCPPMYNGKLCASTTRYNDQTKAACGCGTSDPVPPDWWTLTSFTAALNCKNLDSSDPLLAWCPMGCGGCYKLCTTGGTTQGYPTVPDKCQVFKITNRCGDGYGKVGGDWCSNRLSWKECLENPEKCMEEGSTNWFGYSAHFDLQDFHHQIKDLQWDNVEVTFEMVPCNKSWHGPSWDCSCPVSNETQPGPPAPGTEPLLLPVRSKATTSRRPSTTQHDRGSEGSEMLSIFDSALSVLEHVDEVAARSPTIETRDALVSSTPKVDSRTLTTTIELRQTTTAPNSVTSTRTTAAPHSVTSTGPNSLAESETVFTADDDDDDDDGTAATIEPSVPQAMVQHQEDVLNPEGVHDGEDVDGKAKMEQEMQKEKGKDKDTTNEDEEATDQEKAELHEEEGEVRNNCAGAFQQCGGTSWSGPACCQQGCSCSGSNVFYRQCIPPAGLHSCSEAQHKRAQPSVANGSDSLLVSFVGRGVTEITGAGTAAAVQTVPGVLLDTKSHGMTSNQPAASVSPGIGFSWNWIRTSTSANWQVLALLCALLAGVAVGISNTNFRRGNVAGLSRIGAEHSDDQEAAGPCSDRLRSFLFPLWSRWWPLRDASDSVQTLPESAA